MTAKTKLLVFTGKKNIGKTTFIKQVYGNFSEMGFKINGFIETKTDDFKNYEIENINTQERFPWATKSFMNNKKIDNNTSYDFHTDKLDSIFSSLINSLHNNEKRDIFIFDEFGKMEMRGYGLIKIFDYFSNSHKYLFIVVQESIVDEFLKKYKDKFYDSALIKIDFNLIQSSSDIIREIKAYLR